MTTQADLWSGADLKLERARYFFWRMQKSLERPPRTLSNVALQARHTTMTTDWQRSFYANFDAFLGMCRSVPEIIHAFFGSSNFRWLSGNAARLSRSSLSPCTGRFANSH